jgi:hypothetical protein
MIVRLGPSFTGFILALAAMQAAAQPGLAAAEGRGATALPAPSGCMIGHRFEPGPIVGGRNRQPSLREFQERMAQLSQLEQSDASRCAALQPSVAGGLTPA